MPGLHLALDREPGADNRFERALADQQSDPLAEVRRLARSDGFRAAISEHSGYPSRSYESESCVHLLEGAIYSEGWDDVRASLRTIGGLVSSTGALEREVARFVKATDGDFLVAIYHKLERRLVVFNDRWGRLPTYYHQSADRVVLSRSLAFVLHWLRRIEFNRFSMAEFLTLGYVLGAKSLVNGVHRLEPGSSLLVGDARCGGTAGAVKTIVPSIFASARTVQRAEAAQQCANLFVDGLANRVRFCESAGLEVTADVSAGRDSRANYVGLNRLGAAATYYSDDLDTHNECDFLPPLEKAYGAPVNRIPLKDPGSSIDAPSWARLTYVTDCTVNAWTASLTEYKAIERKKRVQRPAARFMGFGGEFIRTIYKAPRGYTAVRQLIEDNVYFPLFTLRETADLLGMRVGDLMRHFSGYVEAYPEVELEDKLKHLYFEYYNVLVNAGENRHRRHFWTVCPLWSQPLLTFEMGQIPAAMLDRNFFDDFLRRVEPRATDAPFFRKGLLPGSHPRELRYSMEMGLRRFFYRRGLLGVWRASKRWLSHEGSRIQKQSEVERAIAEAYEASSAASLCFGRSRVRDVVERRAARSKKNQLLTLLLYFSEVSRRFGDGVA